MSCEDLHHCFVLFDAIFAWDKRCVPSKKFKENLTAYLKSQEDYKSELLSDTSKTAPP